MPEDLLSMSMTVIGTMPPYNYEHPEPKRRLDAVATPIP